MELSFSPDKKTKRYRCKLCGSKYLQMQRLVLDRGKPFAYNLIEAHKHDQGPEVYFITIVGNDLDKENNDNVTFMCRYGHIEDLNKYACSLVDVPETFQNHYAGKKLTRSEGLKHPRINEFWHVIDFMLENDLDIHDFLHHPRKSWIKTTFSR